MAIVYCNTATGSHFSFLNNGNNVTFPSKIHFVQNGLIRRKCFRTAPNFRTVNINFQLILWNSWGSKRKVSLLQTLQSRKYGRCLQMLSHNPWLLLQVTSSKCTRHVLIMDKNINAMRVKSYFNENPQALCAGVGTLLKPPTKKKKKKLDSRRCCTGLNAFSDVIC